MKKVLALNGNSLLVQGLVSRLRGYAHIFDVRMVDLADPDALEQVSAFQPEIIIFEEADLKKIGHPSLVDFLNSLPEVMLLELRMDDPNVHLIQSVRFSASTTDDLVRLFKDSGSSIAPAIMS